VGEGVNTPDLTLRQHEAHKILVYQLNGRMAKGEKNLIIVDDKIVTCRTNPETALKMISVTSATP
jgi:hypothetical protein